MKTLAFFYIICISSSLFAWDVIHSTEELKVWKSSKFKNIYVSEKIQNKSSELFSNLDNLKSSELNSKKRGFLSLIGVSNWTILKKKIDPENNVIELNGTYLDTRNQLTYFLEIHEYKKNKVIQLLVTSNNSKTKLRNIIKSYRERDKK